MAVPTKKPAGSVPKTNLLLAKLEPDDYEILLRGARVVSLRLRKRLYKQDESIDFVYFPLTCMVSLLVAEGNRPSMEMATVGREGVVGASELIHRQGAMGLHIVQIPGTALRIDSSVFAKVINSQPNVLGLIHQHLFALMRQVLFGAACNRLHSMKERCARWMLMTHDRAGQNEFPLTQESLAHMLGVRRATVNGSTGMLKKAGIISYVRGHVTLIDRSGLEAASCGCYKAIVQSYSSILGSRRT